MSTITNYLSQEISMFGYSFTLGEALVTATATTTALAVVTTCVFKKICNSFPKPLPLSKEKFWQIVKTVQTTAGKEEEPVVIQGKELFPTLKEGKLEMSLSCNGLSGYVKSYLTEKGTVLDLGCGIGANSIPLYQKGWKVTAIDQEAESIKRYDERALRALFTFSRETCETSPHAITGDITTYEYPENVDAVICVDVLPYISPADLRKTLKKIFKALRPGGKFVGTLFFQPRSEKRPVAEFLGKLGAHFYPDKNFASEIITRSGFQIKQQRVRKEKESILSFAWLDALTGRDSSACLEFLAIKPSP
ncbi:class I SAM-dependent methyltransferase [Candidatus Rhabdochlamydia sp. T3358]|uniref:class I SAM-dependent methyltransferase n=1 Tax=Candidatus Rhabdochlamydia sp. T3358 TaxID=2099795 RepID=UPI0010B23797|nr:class I SAM-dependent methyltransferase [Candidatus Rhabdochlamydia sp. T3358]VHO02644.1 Mg-protoporphyrin IX methyl transferase [Candidatus Rhabdochlamydia sp. T3358]